MSLIFRSILGLAVAGLLAPVLVAAGAPPVAAPREPVTVETLPPVGAPASEVVPPPSAAQAPAPQPPQRAIWQLPVFWAVLALVETLGAFAATILYMRRPDRNRLVVALALTGGAAVFIVVALIAWVWA
jgi:hypothetical protein